MFAGWFDYLEAQARAANLGCHPTGVFGAIPGEPLATPLPSIQTALTVTPTWNCVGNRYNCGSFDTCEELMSYWDACPGDPSQLDANNDGIPCESTRCGGETG
jgi:hypothetical protein